MSEYIDSMFLLQNKIDYVVMEFQYQVTSMKSYV